MWVFSKKHGLFNLDNYDQIALSNEGTVLLKAGFPSRWVSDDNVIDIIAEAIDRGYNLVEVE
jgi:hypothetical protein